MDSLTSAGAGCDADDLMGINFVASSGTSEEEDPPGLSKCSFFLTSFQDFNFLLNGFVMREYLLSDFGCCVSGELTCDIQCNDLYYIILIKEVVDNISYLIIHRTSMVPIYVASFNQNRRRSDFGHAKRFHNKNIYYKVRPLITCPKLLVFILSAIHR